MTTLLTPFSGELERPSPKVGSVNKVGGGGAEQSAAPSAVKNLRGWPRRIVSRSAGGEAWAVLPEELADPPEPTDPAQPGGTPGCSDPGDLVIDPFAGSGTSGMAAVKNERRYIGIEKNPKYAKLARLRLRAS